MKLHVIQDGKTVYTFHARRRQLSTAFIAKRVGGPWRAWAWENDKTVYGRFIRNDGLQVRVGTGKNDE